MSDTTAHRIDIGIDDLKAATARLNAAVDALSGKAGGANGGNDKALRLQIVSAANAILTLVKDPAGMGMEAIGQVTLITANRIFWEWEVFDAIPIHDGSSISYEELAVKARAEASLLARMGAVIVSAGILRQVGKDRVAHTPRSRIFRKDEMAGYTYQMAWENAIASFSVLPQYFEKYGRKEPQTQNHVPASYAAGTPELTYYDLLTRDHKRREHFVKAMAPLEESMPITGMYDFGWAVDRAREEAPERVLFVDVGGGTGHALLAIHKEFPGLPLVRCMLQDSPEVIESVESSGQHTDLAQVQKMAIDFNKSQPVKGALIYWIRRCLHNHSDSASATILGHIADAMASDSKLLIQEDVLDDTPDPLASVVDMLMMSFGGKQRTLDCWKQVTSEAGLQISGIFRGTQGSLAVVECTKKFT